MHEELNILRSRKTGAFLMHPYAKFEGFGAFMGVPPYREIAGDVAAQELGDAVLELFKLGGETGYHFDDLEQCLADREDDETRRIRAEYGIGKVDTTALQFAQQFVNGVVQQREGKKSWHIVLKCLDPGLRALAGPDLETVRVAHSKGVEKLGSEILRVFDLSRED